MNINFYNQFRSDADKFNSKIIKIIDKLFNPEKIRLSTDYEDKNLATDLVMTKFQKEYNIGMRIRKFNIYLKYKNEFTVRVPTEFTRIKNGLVQFVFYGFCDPDEKEIISYKILDLSIFRNSEATYKDKQLIKNFDSGHDFYAYNYNEFPKNLVLYEYSLPYEKINKLKTQFQIISDKNNRLKYHGDLYKNILLQL